METISFKSNISVVVFDAGWKQKQAEFMAKKQGLVKPKLAWQKTLGFLFLASSLAGFLLFLSPMIAAKVYQEKQQGFGPIIAQEIKPVEKNFLISIDKIGLANAKVIPQVDVNNENEYQQALQSGVAQAKDTGFPGQGQMVYIFGHSTNYPWFIKNINALFFKLETLELNDRIKIEYNGQHYVYFVTDKKVVGAKEVDTIAQYNNQDVLVLQTCFPPGTFLKRLLLFAKPSKFGSLLI